MQVSAAHDTFLSQLEEEQIQRYHAAEQSQVLKYLPNLTNDEKTALLLQLKSIDVESLPTLLKSAKRSMKTSTDGANDSLNESFTPYSGQVGSSSDKELTQSCRRIGMKAIASNQVAAIVLAGGQGTRLGFDGPKGMYSIGLPSNRSLFQLVAERLLKLTQLAAQERNANHNVEGANYTISEATKVRVPLYVMTSPMNDRETREYFQRNHYFGLDSVDVSFFKQGVMPCLSPDGKILMETQYQCAMAPNGNGGVYYALDSEGVLDDMEGRGIKYLHVFSIDNALARPADPAFVGYCILRKSDCGNKVIWKSCPEEKVGVMARKRGKICVVEYSDLDKQLSHLVDDSTGKLAFGAGNICNHFFTLTFIRNVIMPQLSNMYHVAEKKIPVWDDDGAAIVNPSTNNGIKLESFIFDVFPLSSSMAVWDVVREEEFAPVKNASGSASGDSPDSAREMMSNLAKKWIIDAGFQLEGDSNENCWCEIAPQTSYAGEGLQCDSSNLSQTCPFII